MKREKARVLERMTLKHKTTGKWARGAAQHSQNPENKRLLNEHHKIGEELRRKIEGLGSDEESDGSMEYDSEGYLVRDKRKSGKKYYPFYPYLGLTLCRCLPRPILTKKPQERVFSP